MNKTTEKQVEGDMSRLQLAAYRNLVRENNFDIERCIVCKMGKEDLASEDEPTLTQRFLLGLADLERASESRRLALTSVERLRFRATMNRIMANILEGGRP